MQLNFSHLSFCEQQRLTSALEQVRRFFYQAGVQEVLTPIILEERLQEPNIELFTQTTAAGAVGYLQASPEYAMKRLLSETAKAGRGDFVWVNIFQLANVFRRGDSGALHCEEFKLLEWYRAGRDLRRLRQELLQLIGYLLLNLDPPALLRPKFLWLRPCSYSELFERGGLPVPLTSLVDEQKVRESQAQLYEQARLRGLITEGLGLPELSYTQLLDLLYARLLSEDAVGGFDSAVGSATASIGAASDAVSAAAGTAGGPSTSPTGTGGYWAAGVPSDDLATAEILALDYAAGTMKLLAAEDVPAAELIAGDCEQLLLIYDFPAEQAGFTRTYYRGSGKHVARRFELVWRGIELANGGEEANPAGIYLPETEPAHSQMRANRDLVKVAWSHLPPCCGVALGMERLLARLYCAKSA